jgi:branched-chain amino acid transport system ATP-binding protein
MNALVVEGLKKHFAGNPVLKGVDFELQSGEMLALIGPNGAGKSTVFNLINGQLKPDHGKIELNGESLLGLSPTQICQKGVSRTFQIAQTFSSMTLAENVQMALLSHGKKLYSVQIRAGDFQKEQAIEQLRLVGLHLDADKLSATLAYADVKRLELAMALAHSPRLLLMDEPTAGMAPNERVNLMALIKDLVVHRRSSAQPLSVLFTEHSMEIVWGYAQRVLVLCRGELVAQGRPEEVRDNPLVKEIYLGMGLSLRPQEVTQDE